MPPERKPLAAADLGASVEEWYRWLEAAEASDQTLPDWLRDAANAALVAQKQGRRGKKPLPKQSKAKVPPDDALLGLAEKRARLGRK